MKKTILFTLLFAAALGAHAATADTSVSYLYSSDFNQVRAGATVALGTNVLLGAEGKYIDEKRGEEDGGFKDPVYAVSVPMQLDLDLVKINLSPFYYFKNKTDKLPFQDASAYGLAAQLVMNLRTDEVEDLYTQAYIGASYAKQKGTLFKNGKASDEDYSQLAYTLGLRQNFFSAFTFHMAATAYQYPDGIDGVEGFRGVMDQNDLAFTQSYDYAHALGKYALSARITRIWIEKRSTLYAAYRYGEFYTADAEHSFLVGNTFHVAAQAKLDIAYNHLQTTSGKDKRDILFANLHIAF